MLSQRRTGVVTARKPSVGDADGNYTAWVVALIGVVLGLTLIGQSGPRDQLTDARRISQAIADGDAAGLHELLRDGADPNGLDVCGNPPMLYAATFGETPVVRLLLDAGASVEAPSVAGHKVLAVAAGRGDREIVDLLLGAGADPNTRDCLGHTPLMMAALSARLDVVERLLERGADPTLVDEEGQSALWYAVANCADDTRVTELLLRLDTGIGRRDDAGRTPLHEAVEHGHPAHVERLIRAGADPSASDWARRTPFDVARNRYENEVTADTSSPSQSRHIAETIRHLLHGASAGLSEP